MKLHYDSEGDGPAVVLLHGFPESRLSWKRQLPALAHAGFRAVAPDLRGYGDSPTPSEVDAYRIPAIAEDVAELIESLDGGPCVLVGHDWGAATAWTLAMMRPELIRKLVILNVPHPSAIAREVRRSFRQKLRLGYQVFFQLPLLPELFMRAFGPSLMRRAGSFTPDEIETYARQWRGHLTPMLNYYRALGRARKGGMRKQFQPVSMPTLIIWGEREPVFLASGLDDIGRWVTDVRIERVANAGHFVQRDQPERVSELIIEFAR